MTILSHVVGSKGGGGEGRRNLNSLWDSAWLAHVSHLVLRRPCRLFARTRSLSRGYGRRAGGCCTARSRRGRRRAPRACAARAGTGPRAASRAWAHAPYAAPAHAHKLGSTPQALGARRARVIHLNSKRALIAAKRKACAPGIPLAAFVFRQACAITRAGRAARRNLGRGGQR
eukprot:2282517-Pleurochrysis_carterae.AAC.3